MKPKQIDVQGHRGCRGLLPENTIIAFMKALELGVTTLELDLVISHDNEVIVSHEPFFNHEITTYKGKHLTEKNQKSHNISKLTRKQLEAYDVGLKDHPKFPFRKVSQLQSPRSRNSPLPYTQSAKSSTPHYPTLMSK